MLGVWVSRSWRTSALPRRPFVPSLCTGLTGAVRGFASASATTSVGQRVSQPIEQIKDNNGAIWLSNVYASGKWTSRVLSLATLAGFETNYYLKRQKQISSSFDEIQFPGIRQIIPRFKEGGCYVTFATREQSKQVLQELSNTLAIDQVEKQAYLVQGKPFIEDLTHHWPSRRLSMELIDVAQAQQKLTPELVFAEMRPYGKMKDISIDPKGQTAVVEFLSVHSAISARNCLHLKSIGDSRFNIRYIPYSRIAFLLEFFKNPRILIPLLGILISISLYLLVDPTRSLSVTQKLTRGYKDDELASMSSVELENISEVREELFSMLRKGFQVHPDSVFVVTGPEGSGKSLLMRRLLHKRAFTFRINCKEDKTIMDFIDTFGSSIGFAPSFNSLSSVLNYLESFIPGLKKSALSPSANLQLKSMLRCLDGVLFLLSAGYPARRDKEWDYALIVFDGFHQFLETMEAVEDKEKANQLLSVLLQWVHKNSRNAHIVFVGENHFGEEKLKSHPLLRKTKVKSLTVGDLEEPEMSSFIRSMAPDQELDPSDLSIVYDKIGGRISDLESLVYRFNSGIPLIAATTEMINNAEQHIRNLGFGGHLLADSGGKWTKVHLWKAIKQIASHKEVSYDSLLISAFSGNTESLKSLVKERLLHVKVVNGKKVVSSVSTLQHNAMKQIVQCWPLKRSLEILEKKTDIQTTSEDAKKIEEELARLTEGESRTMDPEALASRRVILTRRLGDLNIILDKKLNDLKTLEDSPVEGNPVEG